MWLHLFPSWVKYNDFLLARKFLWEIFVCWFPSTIPNDSCMTENLPFLRGQHQALPSVLPSQLYLRMPFMTNIQIPLTLEGKTLLGWAPVWQAWNSAGIIYEKAKTAQQVGEREGWSKKEENLQIRTPEHTQVYSVPKSSCLLVHPLIFQKYTIQNRYKARQLGKKII